MARSRQTSNIQSMELDGVRNFHGLIPVCLALGGNGGADAAGEINLPSLLGPSLKLGADILGALGAQEPGSGGKVIVVLSQKKVEDLVDVVGDLVGDFGDGRGIDLVEVCHLHISGWEESGVVSIRMG